MRLRVVAIATAVAAALIAGALAFGHGANAAQPPAVQDVREQNVDAAGNIKVVEQGTVPVAVGNPAAPAEPYMAVIDCASTGSDFCESVGDPIPAGKRLVIQTISAEGRANLGVTLGEFRIDVTSGAGDGSGVFDLLGQRIGDRGSDTLSAADSRAVTLYADAGSRIDFSVISASGSASRIGAVLDVSGYLVPMS